MSPYRSGHGLGGYSGGMGRPGYGGSFGGASGSTLLVGLESLWRLDEESDVRVDQVGSNDLADVNTVGYAAGKIGNAANFIRTNNEALTASAFLGADAVFTFSLWFKPDDTTRNTLIDSGGDGDIYLRATANNAGGGSVEWVLKGFTLVVSAFAQTIPTGTWHHIVCWYNPTTDEAGFALNNGSPVTGSGGPNGTPASFLLGRRGANIEPMDGAMDLVGCWSRVLTADERTELYNGGSGFDPTA